VCIKIPNQGYLSILLLPLFPSVPRLRNCRSQLFVPRLDTSASDHQRRLSVGCCLLGSFVPHYVTPLSWLEIAVFCHCHPTFILSVLATAFLLGWLLKFYYFFCYAHQLYLSLSTRPTGCPPSGDAQPRLRLGTCLRWDTITHRTRGGACWMCVFASFLRGLG
jgi:hypothetical protein